MKPISFLIVLISLFFLTNCQQGDTQTNNSVSDAEVAEEIAQLWKDYIELANKGDVESLRSFFDDEHINMPSYEFTQYGGAETYEMIADFLKNNSNEISDYQQIEVFVHGDMAYEFATIEQITIQPDQDIIPYDQRCISVFKKQEDGSWKFYLWMAQV